MNWEAIAALGETAGAVGVMLTLVFLAAELRRGRLGGEVASVDSLAAGWNAVNIHVMNDPELAEIYTNGFRDPTKLTPIQRTRLLLMGQCYVNQFTALKKRYDAGLLPEVEWEIHSRGMSHILNAPGGRWVCENTGITPDLLEVIDAYRDQPRADGFVGISHSPPHVAPDRA